VTHTELGWALSSAGGSELWALLFDAQMKALVKTTSSFPRVGALLTPASPETQTMRFHHIVLSLAISELRVTLLFFPMNPTSLKESNLTIIF
jgi:hypothetical protein